MSNERNFSGFVQTGEPFNPEPVKTEAVGMQLAMHDDGTGNWTVFVRRPGDGAAITLRQYLAERHLIEQLERGSK